MEMKNIMEDFIKYKEQLDDVERNGLEDTTDETYEKLFMKLRDTSFSYKVDGVFTTAEGEKRCNISRNRYKDIVPYDHTRVKLTCEEGGSDYINASYIKGVLPSQKYIAAQGPLPETVEDFWKMLWENNIKVVLMACNEYEGIPRKLRCQRYWSNDANETLEFGDITVALSKEQNVDYEEYTVRHLKATRGGETRDVTHLHYTAWPDRGTPKCIPSILDMIELMRTIQPANQIDVPPVVVHCSAGCGRTGTILVLDYVGNMIKSGKLTKDFSLYNVISEMRKQRMAIVQSLDQYVFVHEAVVELFNRQLQMMEQHNYYNVPSGGLKAASANPPSPESSTQCQYELINLRSPVEKSPPLTAARKPSPTKLDVVTPKPRTSTSSSGSEQRTSTDRPPPISPKPPSFSSPTADAGNVAVYAAVHNKPQVAIASKPTSSPVVASLPSPAASAEYAEVDMNPKGSTGGGSPKRNNSYEYADPNATGKWSLQHVARNAPEKENAYATIDPAYSEHAYASIDIPDKRPQVVSESDSDGGAPELPYKPHLQTTDDGQSAPSASQGSTFDRFKQRVTDLIPTPKPPDLSSFSCSGQPVKVIFHGMDISYPNRVPRPKYGKRPVKMLAVSGVR